MLGPWTQIIVSKQPINEKPIPSQQGLKLRKGEGLNALNMVMLLLPRRT